MTRVRTPADRRSSRGRLIVLGNDAVIESVARATHRPTTLARHMYDVIGELAQAGLLDAPKAVLASLEALGDRSGPFTEAVRRLDPAVELIALAHGEPAPIHEMDGFDAVLPLPLSAEALEDAIDGRLAGSVLARGVECGEALAPGVPSPQSSARPDPGLREAARSSDGSLGDVDLVEAVLRNPDDVAPLALRLIEQETGWKGLRIDAGASLTAPCVEIIAGQASGAGFDRFGYLIGGETEAASRGDSTPAAAQLHPWAQWLAHWLRLARTVADLRLQAMTDELTGAYNRRFFDEYLSRAIDEARARRQCVSLLLFDIDDFKVYNDRYGHGAGDEILVETVKLLRSVIRPNDRVCRIGGDEFVVIFHDPQGQRERGSSHPDDIQKIARRFQQQICRHCFPKLSAEAPGTLTISGGLATYPWDGMDVASLLEQADRNALLSKRAGKNAITFGPGATDICNAQEPPNRPAGES